MSTVDDRNAPFYWVDSKIWDYGLSPFDVGIYSFIVQSARGNSKGCFKKIKTIARETGTSTGSVKRSLARLIERNMISREVRPGYSSIYRLTDASQWVKPEAEPGSNRSRGVDHIDPGSTQGVDQYDPGGGSNRSRGVDHIDPPLTRSQRTRSHNKGEDPPTPKIGNLDQGGDSQEEVHSGSIPIPRNYRGAQPKLKPTVVDGFSANPRRKIDATAARFANPGHRYPILCEYELGDLWVGPKRNDWNPQLEAGCRKFLENHDLPHEPGDVKTHICNLVSGLRSDRAEEFAAKLEQRYEDGREKEKMTETRYRPGPLPWEVGV